MPLCEILQTFWQNWSKSLSNSKLEAFSSVDMKLRPLLNKRIWGSDRSLLDKLVTNNFAHVIQLLIEQQVILGCTLNA